MNNIKYRVWSIKENQFVDNIVVMSDGHRLYIGNFSHEDVDSKDYIIQRAVNFKDKDGQDIYEGDFVQADYGYGCPPCGVEYEDFIAAKVDNRVSPNILILDNILELETQNEK